MIGVVPPVVRISGTVIVRRVRRQMDVCSRTTQAKMELVQRKRLAKEIEMTLARAQSLPVKYSGVKMILVTSLEFS